jgi:hypothetical protein
MRFIARVCLVLAVFFAGTAGRAGGAGGFHYRIRVWKRGEPAPVEGHFVMVPTPPLVTANKVKKPRLGGWRLEMDQTVATRMAPAVILARAEGLLYLAGPSPQARPRNFIVRYGGRRCPVWQVDVPKGLSALAYLAEVGPDLLALSYVSVCPRTGDMASIEIQLESFELGRGVSPAEDGMALIRTLQEWASAPADTTAAAKGGEAETVAS